MLSRGGRCRAPALTLAALGRVANIAADHRFGYVPNAPAAPTIHKFSLLDLADERRFTIVRANLGAEGAAGDLPRRAEPSFAREVAVC